MIEREGGRIVFHCDSCSEIFEGDTGDFNSEWAGAKERGWRAYKVKNEWCHRCPSCDEDDE
jgi:hypothetical protein